MKRFTAVFIAALLLLLTIPAYALPGFFRFEPAAQNARTTLLDLTNQTVSVSNSLEGWSFDPRGYNGKPLLTLNSYGRENAHSAPIKLPKDTKLVVNGACYIDNCYMGQPYSVIGTASDGYLIIDGSGTLNLYAQAYNGRCIDIPAAGFNNQRELLYINNVTVNCYSMERDMYSAATLEPCIYALIGIYVTNAVINTQYGSCGLKCYGYTPIGGVTEETAAEIVIDSSRINIQNYSDNGLWGHALGISTTFGKIRITGSSDVTINAGSNSIYCYLSLTIEGGNVNILSTPLSTADSAAIVRCGSLVLKNTLSSIYFSTTRYPLTKILVCRLPGESSCENGIQFQVGSFRGGEFNPGADPDNGDLPAIKATGSGSASVLMGDVDGDGSVTLVDALLVLRFAMGIINELPVPQAANVDGNTVTDLNDALMILRASMGLLTL